MKPRPPGIPEEALCVRCKAAGRRPERVTCVDCGEATAADSRARYRARIGLRVHLDAPARLRRHWRA